MKIQLNELENGIRLIKMIGALDMNGTYAIEVEFVHHCSGDNARILVDLSKVTYLSSIGIPMLINTAKAVTRRGGKMALLNPQQNVAEVLEIIGISQLIPIYTDLESAKAGVSSG